MSNSPPSPQTRSALPVWAGALLLFGATVAAYLPALGAGFVWNDVDYVTAPGLRSLSGLWLIWFKLGATQQYYPVLHSAFWFEHRIWGEAAVGYHMANIVLHASSAVVFSIILRRLSVPGAWLAGLIFAVHPVCAESVAWISEQKNTLSTVFYLLAGLGYLRWREGSPGAARGMRLNWLYWLSTAVFVLALLSKSMAATLPAALLVVAWWQRGRITWREDVRPLIAWIVLGAAAGLFTGWVERTYIGAAGSDFAFSPVQRTLIAGRAAWFYLGKLLWPTHLIFIYPRWEIDAGAAWQYLFPLGAVALTAGLWAIRGRTRGPLAGWLFFVGSLFPILGFLNVYAFVFSFVADHWQYLASLGVIAVAAAGWGKWAAAAGGPGKARILESVIPWSVAAGIVCALGFLTSAECRNYRDPETFYRTILERNPACWMAHNNLGFALEGEGKTAEALPHFEEALRLRPQYIEAHNNYGAALYASGRTPEAIAHYEEALRLMPRYAQAHNNLGNALASVGRMPEAIAHYREAMRLDPNYADAPYNLGVTLAGLGRQDEAAACYREAIRIRPGYSEAHNNLGNIFLRSGRLAEAAASYRQALRYRPDYADALVNLGAAVERSGRPEEAMVHYQMALRLAPNDAKAHFYLGNVFSGMSRRSEALAEYEAAVRLDPMDAGAHNNLGAMLYVLGRPTEAMAQVAEAVRLAPDYIDARNNLGVLLEGAGRKDEARAQFEIAARLKSKN